MFPSCPMRRVSTAGLWCAIDFMCAAGCSDSFNLPNRTPPSGVLPSRSCPWLLVRTMASCSHRRQSNLGERRARTSSANHLSPNAPRHSAPIVNSCPIAGFLAANSARGPRSSFVLRVVSLASEVKTAASVSIGGAQDASRVHLAGSMSKRNLSCHGPRGKGLGQRVARGETQL
jgi:hypothetical protein